MRRLFVIAALLGALGITAAALAAGNPPITEKILGAASISDSYTIDVNKPGDVVVAKATVPPGASFGWHSHRAAVAVVVKSGTLTLYDSADPSCTPQRYSAGQGFVEQPQPRPSRPQRRQPAGRGTRHLPRAQARRQPRRAGRKPRELSLLGGSSVISTASRLASHKPKGGPS